VAREVTASGGSVISAEEWELVSFFGDLPTYRPEDEPWPYTEIVFEIQRGDHALSCAIFPAYKDVRLILSSGEARLYELNAVGVNDIAYLKEGTIEQLEIQLDDHIIVLQVDPTITIEHQAGQASPKSGET
jgi:hypothetical protein